jgi:hypothetical protein
MTIDPEKNSPADNELIGRVVSEIVNEMVQRYFNHLECVTTLQKQLTNFEVKRGKKNRWVQVAISVNFDPVTFMDENETRPGAIDEKTFIEIVDAIASMTDATLNKMEQGKVNPYIAESFVNSIEKFTETLRNKLLTINSY